MRKFIIWTAAALFVAAATTVPALAQPKPSNICVSKKPDKVSPILYRASTAPRDTATGQAVGRRVHKPVR
jgi:hypothetical protein